MSKPTDWLDQPKNAIKVHGFLFWFWIALAVVALIFGFIGSTIFISILSIVALSISHWSAIQGAKAQLEEKK